MDISDRIKLQLTSKNPHILEVAKSFAPYIKEQVLANDLECVEEKISAEFSFDNKLDDGDLGVGINR